MDSTLSIVFKETKWYLDAAPKVKLTELSITLFVKSGNTLNRNALAFRFSAAGIGLAVELDHSV